MMRFAPHCPSCNSHARGDRGRSRLSSIDISPVDSIRCQNPARAGVATPTCAPPQHLLPFPEFIMRVLALISALLLVACAPHPGEVSKAASAGSSGTHTVTLRVQVPESLKDAVYVTGNIEALGPWDPAGALLTGSGSTRSATLEIAHGHAFEYKFTLGSWDREAVDEHGIVLPNQTLQVDADAAVDVTLKAFKQGAAVYMADVQGSGVLGTLIYWPDVHSAFLEYPRHVSIWLPTGYAENPERRYRVLYMSDGQNLFDPRIANTGVDWGVDEAMMRVAEVSKTDPAIVVAAWSSPARGSEYSPWHDAPKYARFLTEELMPRVNAEFRTLTGPNNTFHMGSSMGGLLSFYLVVNRPEAFGACGCLSTHFPLSEAMVAEYFRDASTPAMPDTTPYVIRDIEAGMQAPSTARFWFDHGTLTLDAEYAPTHARVRDWLLAQGKREGQNFVVRSYPGASHNEAAWRARLDDSLTFLLAPPQASAQ
jgi:enterochelin esterase-like enzyme